MSTSPAARCRFVQRIAELRLKPREEKRLAAGHLWVFSNEVDTVRTPLTAFGPASCAACCRAATASSAMPTSIRTR